MLGIKQGVANRKMRINKSCLGLILVFLPVSLALPACGLLSGEKSLRIIQMMDVHTIKLSNDEKVRLLGVDALPKYDCLKLDEYAERLGKDKKLLMELRKKTVEFAEKLYKGKKIRLEYGPSKQDNYGHWLAYVYLPDDKLLNEEIILQGYGFVDLKSNELKQEIIDRLKEAESKAEAAQCGLWGEGLENP